MPEQLSLLDAPKEILPLLFPTQQPAPVATLPDPPPTWIDCPPEIEFRTHVLITASFTPVCRALGKIV